MESTTILEAQSTVEIKMELTPSKQKIVSEVENEMAKDEILQKTKPTTFEQRTAIDVDDEPFGDVTIKKEQREAINADKMIERLRSSLLKEPELPKNVILNGDQQVEAKQLLDTQLSVKAVTQFELEERLRICGNIIRTMNAKLDKSGIFKVSPLSEKNAARVMHGLMNFKRVGDTDNDSTPFMVYDLDKGIYREKNLYIGKMINLLEPRFKKSGREETKTLIMQDCEYTQATKDKNLAVLGNGIYNIETKEFSPFSPKHVFLTKASVDWNENAKCPVFPDGWTFDSFLDEQFENKEEDKYAMYQLLQLALLSNKAKKVFVYFYSKEGRTGKGTMTELIRHLVGVENSGSANLIQLESNFGLESIYDKSFVFGNENDSVWNTRGNDNIKNLATGDTLTVQRKSIINISASLTPLIVQSMNSTPKFNTLDSAITNRMRIFEFTHSYYDDDNEMVKEEYVKSKELLEYLAYKVLTMPVTGLVDTQTSKTIKNDIAVESNPIVGYIDERINNFKGDTFTIASLFPDFRAWCYKSNTACDYSRRMFSDKLIAAMSETFEYCNRQRGPIMDDDDLKSIMSNIAGSDMSKNIKSISDFYNTNRQAVITKRAF